MKNRDDNRILPENLEIPVMMMAGKGDKRIPMDVIMSQAALLNYCELILLDQVGHMGFIEATENTFKIINSFSQRILLD